MADAQKWFLDGIALAVESVTDNFSAALAKYSFPYSNGAKLDFLGIEERSIKLKIFFIRDRYDEHRDFLQMMFTVGVGHELTHPVFGYLKGKIEGSVVNYDERKRCAAIDLTFIVEDDTSIESYGISESVSANCEASFSDGQAALMDTVSAAITGAAGDEASDVLDAVIDEEQTLLEQFTGVSQGVRDYLSEIDDFVGICESQYADYLVPASSLVESIDYGTGLPGRIAAAMARSLDRTAYSIRDAALSPASALANLKSGYAAFAALFTNSLFDARDTADLAVAQRYAMETAWYYEQDNAGSMQLETMEAADMFSIDGSRTPGNAMPALMTINDLEETLYNARLLLQAAINSDRANAGIYKKMASDLLTHVETARLQRERIITKTLPTEMPLHAACQRFGLPIISAERLLSINPQITNPTFTKGAIQIYA